MALQPGTVEQIARALGQCTPLSTGFKCLCPAHPDQNPSLVINFQGNKDGRPTVKCMSGCDPKAIFAAIEEKTGFYFADREKKRFDDPKKERSRQRAVLPAPIPWPSTFSDRSFGVPNVVYPYYNEKDELMFVICRWETPNDPKEHKKIRQASVQEVGGQMVWKLGGLAGVTQRPLYNLTELLSRPDAPVLITEGEKAADRAKTLPEFKEYVVVTWSQGMTNYLHTDWTPLRSRKVYLWPDNDYNMNSYQNFTKIAMMVNVEGFAAECYIAQIPRHWPDKWDLGDALPSNGKYSDVVWHEAVKPSYDELMKSITPANYMEVFSSLYHLGYDGKYRYTIDLKRYHYNKGRAVTIKTSGLCHTLNGHHPVARACMVKGATGIESGVMNWSDEQFKEDKVAYGFTFAPNNPDMVVEENGAKKMNSWTGWLHEPSSTGSCELFKEFVFDGICAGDQNAYDYLMNFLAHMIQFPEERPTVAVVLQGQQGTGKNTFFDIVGDMLGGADGYSKQIPTVKVALEKHNGWMIANSLAVFIVELELTTSRTGENTIKNLITDPYIKAEYKYVDAYQAKNLARIFGGTNHEHVWNVMKGERRLSIFEVSDKYAGDLAFFNAMRKQMRTGGYSRMMHELATYHVNKDLVRQPLENKARSRQAMYTTTPVRVLAERLLKSRQIFLKIMDENRDVAAFWQETEEDWINGPVHIPGKILRMAIDEIFAKGKWPETRYSAQDPEFSTIGLVRLLGGDGTYRGKMASINGQTTKTNAFVIPSHREAVLSFCNHLNLDPSEVFDQTVTENVVPFPKAVAGAKPDDVPF